MTGLEDILQIEGIVIRKIPKITVSRWTYREGDENRLKSNERIVTNEQGRKFVEIAKENSMAGYIVTFDKSQGSTVLFNKKRDGVGSTIEEAYKDLLTKRA